MKTSSGQAEVRAFTLVEFLVTLVFLALLAVFLMPYLVKKEKKEPYDTMCLANQRQLALELNVWKNDHKGEFPWQVTSANGKSEDFVTDGNAAAIFQNLSNSAPGRVALLLCPSDRRRGAAANYAELENRNISYFVAMDAGRSPAASILTGDRHLESNREAVQPGLFVYSTNAVMRWTTALHASDSGPVGILSFYDGHAQIVHGTNLDSVFRQEGLATNRLAVP